MNNLQVFNYNNNEVRTIQLEDEEKGVSQIATPGGSVRVTRTTKVTGKGQTYFVNKFLGEVS